MELYSFASLFKYDFQYCIMNVYLLLYRPIWICMLLICMQWLAVFSVSLSQVMTALNQIFLCLPGHVKVHC